MEANDRAHVDYFNSKVWKEARRAFKTEVVQMALRDQVLHHKDKRIILDWLRRKL